MTCPFCALVAGEETERNAKADVVYRDSRTTAFVSPRWWDASPGHVIVVPNEHVQSVHELSDELLAAVYATAKRVAGALKRADACEGTSMRQHDERGAGQEIPHFHVHVFPRNADDRLYERNEDFRWAPVEERRPRALLIRGNLDH